MPPQKESMSFDEAKKRPHDRDDYSTPRSVYLASEQSVRDDVSDLSGSYMGGLNNGRSSVPRTVYQEASPSGPWRQAYVASKLPPPKPSICIIPPSMVRGRHSLTARSNPDGSVEVINQIAMSSHSDVHSLQNQYHNRTPVTVLLIDGNKRTYELLQVWIDRSVDSVRSVVQTVQRGIPQKKWKTAYDGLFQVRGNRFTQLIHILQIAKYDIRPHEVLIAKPAKMSSKVAYVLAMPSFVRPQFWSKHDLTLVPNLVTQHSIAQGNSAIRHLTNIQVITTDEEGRNRPKPSDSGPLLLSSAAQKRIFCPDGILAHHHTTQFLTFCPPFDVNFETVDKSSDDVQSTQGSHVSSIGMNSIQGQMVDELIASLRRTREQLARIQEHRDPLVPPVEGSESSTVSRSKDSQTLELFDASRDCRNVANVMSHLNCFKTKQRVAAFACCPHPENDHSKIAHHPLNGLISVAEDQSTHAESLAGDATSPPLTGIEMEASMFYVRGRNGRLIRLMEI
jgi:hypothetical protein